MGGQTHLTMNRVAWLTCAVLSIAHARIYERCELARELQALGVEPRHIATWVCIAFHESRFDTAAMNYNSGDHGIFQISELFWCGPGKACGLPCTALRDEDISNDFKCAMEIYNEHTRLQGDGFRAWVVYPMYCAHNTKKYIVDCDISVKYSVPITRFRDFAYQDNYLTNSNYTHNEQPSLPSYLAIRDIYKGFYGKMLDQTEGTKDWYNYKINNIDELKISSNKPQAGRPSTTTSTPTTTEYFPPVIPWRRIETNQFRKKQFYENKDLNKQPIDGIKNSLTINNLDYSETSRKMQSPRRTSQEPIVTTRKSYEPYFSSTKISTTTLPYSFSAKKSHFMQIANVSDGSIFRSVLDKTENSSVVVINPSKTTKRVTYLRWTTPKPKVSETSKSKFGNYVFTTQSTITSKQVPDYSPYAFTSRTTTTSSTLKLQTMQTTTARPNLSTSLTVSQTTTRKPRPTQSIFDLYLNPTKPPRLTPLQFDSPSSSKFKIKIFGNGTTTVAPPKRTFSP